MAKNKILGLVPHLDRPRSRRAQPNDGCWADRYFSKGIFYTTKYLRLFLISRPTKLHMIENRARIERQIYLGRQAVRRTLQTSGRQAAAESTTTMPVRLSTTPPPTGTDQPLSVDTDAEAAYAAGARKLLRRHRQSSNGQLTPRPGGSQGFNSKNSSSSSLLLHPASTHDQRTDPLLNKMTNGDDFPSGYMSRLQRSFPSALQFKESEMDEDGWSSESSSDDDLEAMDDHQRQASHSSLPPLGDDVELERDEWSG